MEPSRLWCRSGHGVLGEVGGSVRRMRGPDAGIVKKSIVCSEIVSVGERRTKLVMRGNEI